jgi:hypothetical protein
MAAHQVAAHQFEASCQLTYESYVRKKCTSAWRVPPVAATAGCSKMGSWLCKLWYENLLGSWKLFNGQRLTARSAFAEDDTAV